MEKEFFLLGLIKNSELYGYQINELIDSHFNIIVNITRATAYRLLNKMAGDGWIDFREEHFGTRPPRKVYSITPKGEIVFEKILRQSLVNYKPNQEPNMVSFAFLETIAPDELAGLLSERRNIVKQQVEKLKESKKHQADFQLMFDYQFRHLETELIWIEDIFKRLDLKESNN